MPVEISVPFRVGSNGHIATEANPDVQVRQHVEALVGTEPGERVMLPDFGVPTSSLLFEPDDDIVQSFLVQHVEDALTRWIPGVLVRNVQAVPNQRGDGLAGVQVDFERAGSARTAVTTPVNSAYIRVGGRVSEVVRG